MNKKEKNDDQGRLHRKLPRWRLVSVLLMVFDVLIVNGAYFMALWVRFDFRFSQIEAAYFEKWLHFAPIYTVVCLLVFTAFHLYKSLWQFVSYDELKNIMLTTLITGAFHAVGITLLFGRMPLSYYVLGVVLQFVAVAGLRFSYRFLTLLRDLSALKGSSARMNRCMLIGAGAAGRIILRDFHYAQKAENRIVCIIDDDPNKHGRFVEGIKVVGGRDDILLNVEKYNIEKIIIAIPSASPEDKREIFNICKESGCVLKQLPAVYEPTDGSSLSAFKLQDVNLEDLLGRPPIKVEMEEIYQFLSGKVILVTGGGGSIGSELCRQIAKNKPQAAHHL